MYYDSLGILPVFILHTEHSYRILKTKRCYWYPVLLVYTVSETKKVPVIPFTMSLVIPCLEPNRCYWCPALGHSLSQLPCFCDSNRHAEWGNIRCFALKLIWLWQFCNSICYLKDLPKWMKLVVLQSDWNIVKLSTVVETDNWYSSACHLHIFSMF